MTPPSGLERHVAQRHRAEPPQRRRKPEVEKLERDRWHESLDELVRPHDHDEAVGRSGDCLLARVRGTATFDEPALRVDLVGSVDRDVEASRRAGTGERLDRQAQLACRALRRRRCRDAPEVERAGS